MVENYRQNGVDGRPVVNTSSALTVTISFSLIQILHFEPTEHVITLVGWISLVYASLDTKFFAVNPFKPSGVKWLHFKVFRPAILV